MKILNLPHKQCDYTCMWNGIEDIYEWKTRLRTPDYLFFGISGFCNFVYLKQNKADCKRMIYWSNGLSKTMYEFMGEIVGYQHKIYEGNTFNYSLRVAKNNIDSGNPVVLGALDMFYLPYYEKYFNNIHIPIHHFLMIGYDDDSQQIFLHDCGKHEVQSLDYENLKKAWDVNLPGFSKRNSLFEIKFNENINNLESIVRKGLLKKCEINLNPPVTIFGIPAMKKLGREILKWKEELCEDDFKRCLYHLVEYTGFPPALPGKLTKNRLLEDEKIPNDHRGSREQFSKLLINVSENYNIRSLEKASKLFHKSGAIIEELTNILVDYLIDKNKNIACLPKMIKEITDIEEESYKNIKSLLQ